MGKEEEAAYSPLKWRDGPPSYLITTHIKAVSMFNTCPRSQTLEAFSTTLKCNVWIALNCKCWSCPFCATQKIYRLSRKTEEAKPTRLLTLTVDPSLYESPRDAFDATRRCISELAKKLRDRYGEFEYLRVTEITRQGWPHYHLLVRSQYIPHEVVKKLWHELTGAIIVDIRQVKNRFDTFFYLVKYLSKLKHIEWTERHVSFSKKFFPPDKYKHEDRLGLTEHHVIETHPGTMLFTMFRGATITEITPGVFALNPPRCAIEWATADGSETVSAYWTEPCSPSTTEPISPPVSPTPPAPSTQDCLFSKRG